MHSIVHRLTGFLHRPASALALLMLLLACAVHAQAQEPDPPGRVALVTVMQGSVVYAPDGEDEWTQLPANRPLTRGDRVWTDRGARAELHMGTTVLHLASQSNLAFYELDDDSAQLSLTQGSLNARVRELQPGENVEIDTPNLALRATQPGDFRVDVDAAGGTTRVLVRSGEAQVFGERGDTLRLRAGQQATFAGRDLQQLRADSVGDDGFDQWANDRNRAEDASVSARHLPRGVVGYSQLDAYGTWSADPEYGTVWFPRVTVQNWAPYREGRWMYIRPWGWTWVDEAPWGFAPFHYGRWAVVGSRWAWVPGRMGPRPVYAPALVGFVGGAGVSLTIGSGPGIGWYPLAPGEAWWPAYRTSNVYVTNVNRHVTARPNVRGVHVHRGRPNAVTAVRMDDFNRGRPVREAWRPLRPDDIARAASPTELPRPVRERDRDRGRDRDGDRDRDRDVRPGGPAGLQGPPRSAILPVVPSLTSPGQGAGAPRVRDERRVEEIRRDDDRRQREQPFRVQQERVQRDHEQREQTMREQQDRARGEQERQVREQRDQMLRMQQERMQREQQVREQGVREQQDRLRGEQERQMREQREQVQRMQQERLQREQQVREQGVREQQDRLRGEQERQMREQREQVQRMQQERFQREQGVREQQERLRGEQERAQRDLERAQREMRLQQQRDQQPAGIGRPERDNDSRGRGARSEQPAGQSPGVGAPPGRDDRHERPRHPQRIG